MATKPLLVELQHALILQAWDCLIGGGKVTYISGPITTGLTWVKALETGMDHGRPVIEANCAVIRLAANHMRHQTGKLVLEPASLSVENWSQEDYLSLWTTLIERHASTVAFVDGWEYSIGCALEFERAVGHDIPTITLGGSHISVAAGIRMLFRAAEELAQHPRGFRDVIRLGERLNDVASRMNLQNSNDS